MKKSGIFHGDLSKIIAELEHFDTILIGDAGMPCPPGVKWIDLAVCEGVPSFFDVLDAVLGELEVQRGVISSSWGWSRSQGLGCSPIKEVRELGSERRETVRSLSSARAGDSSRSKSVV